MAADPLGPEMKIFVSPKLLNNATFVIISRPTSNKNSTQTIAFLKTSRKRIIFVAG